MLKPKRPRVRKKKVGGISKVSKTNEFLVTKSRKKAKITKEEEDDKKLCKESIPSPDINIHRSESGGKKFQ